MNINQNNLSLLTNNELIAELERLVAEEKKITLEVVRHLSEVEERKLYLELGYSSMFDYATRGTRVFRFWSYEKNKSGSCWSESS